MNKDRWKAVQRARGIFTEPPRAVPAGDVDVSGGGRWRIWQDAGTKIDAPILGNGDLLAAFAGPREYPQFWFTTNDFWQMESAANWEFFHDNGVAKADPPMSLGSPRPVGRLVFTIPELKDTAYQVEQEYFHAKTSAIYTWENGEQLTITSLVAATENELLIRFKSDRRVAVQWDMRFPDEIGKGCDIGVDFDGTGESEELKNGMFVGMVGGRPVQVKKVRDGLLSGYREFSDRVDVPTRVGFSGRFLEASDGSERTYECGALSYDSEASMELLPGVEYTYVLSVRSWAKVSRPYEYAVSRTRWFRKQDVDILLAQHASWWENYWSISGIELEDPILEKRYYLSQYMMASVSRDPVYPPNILGISTFDRPAWNGNYKINYNHQSPYLGLLVSGHFEQSDPHDAPYLDLLDIAREMSRRLLHHDGCLYPLGLGPAGMVSESLLLYMKSPAVHGALNMIMRYELTLDPVYGRKVFPFLLAVADFWENDLVLRDGTYHVVGDGMHERVVADVKVNGLPEDPVNTLGYLKTFFGFLPKIARDLNLATDRIETWEHFASHIAPYPKGTVREITDNPTLWAEADANLSDLLPEEYLDRPIYYDEGKGGKWSHHFPGNVMHIYPGNAIGLSSDPKELEAAYNTVEIHALAEGKLAEFFQKKDPERESDPHFYKAGAWNADNLSCLFFPAAVRVGYPPEKILKELRDRIAHRGIENGYYRKNPHGIENLSTVPNTLQEMMLQSHEGVIRIFPNWPREEQPNASFFGMRTYGAFVVEAALRDGEVSFVKLDNTHGKEGLLENPWGTSEVLLTDTATGEMVTLFGTRLAIPARMGEFLLKKGSELKK